MIYFFYKTFEIFYLFQIYLKFIEILASYEHLIDVLLSLVLGNVWESR